MSGTFEKNWPVLERHVEDFRHIERNAEMIMLSSLCRLESRPTDIKGFEGFPIRVSEYIKPGTIHLIPDTDALIRVFERDPMEDLRRYFATITNAV